MAIPCKDLKDDNTVGMDLHSMWLYISLNISSFEDYTHTFLAHQSVLHSTCSLYKERCRTMPFFKQSFQKQWKAFSLLKDLWQEIATAHEILDNMLSGFCLRQI